jgi:hypothetical protein
MRRHLTFSNVTALLALFVALGGVSYAAIALPKNSVGAKQLKASSVNSAKVKDGSLQASDFKSGTLGAGSTGPAGQTGPMGPPGSSVSAAPSVVPAASITNSIGQNIPKNAFVSASFDTETFDTQGLHSAGAPARLTAPIGGFYEVFATVAFDASSTTGIRTMEIAANGTTGTAIAADSSPGVVAGAQYLSATGLAKLSAGEYVEVHVLQTTSGNLSLLGVGNFATPRFSMQWVGPAG